MVIALEMPQGLVPKTEVRMQWEAVMMLRIKLVMALTWC